MFFAADRNTELDDWFRRIYVPDRLPGDGHKRTRSSYETAIRTLNKFFAELCVEAGVPVRKVRLDDLCDELLKGAMEWQLTRPVSETRGGRKIPTSNRLYRSITPIWRLAVDKGILATPPKTKKYRELKYEPICWSPEEFDAILLSAGLERGRVGDCTAAAWWLALILFEWNVGCRITAAMHTPSANLDFERAEVLVPAAFQKQGADQRFDLLPITVDALKLIRPQRHARIFDDWPYDRTQDSWPALNNGLRRILRRADLPTTDRDLFHKIRRTNAGARQTRGKDQVSGSVDTRTAVGRIGHANA